MFTFLALLATPSATLEHKLDDPDMKGATVTLCVADGSGQILFEKDSERRMLPASNQKLLSTLWFLGRRGWDPLPSTKFWRQDNAIVVQSTGDPTLSLAEIQVAAKKLGAPTPKVVLIQDYRPGFHPNWEYDDMPNRYGAGIASFCVDAGSFTFKIVKGKILPPMPQARIKVVREPSDRPLAVRYDVFGAKLTVSGKVTPQTDYSENFSYLFPDRVAAGFLGKQVVFADSTKVPGRAPDLEISADATEDVIRHCLVQSDNTFAENLLLLAASKEGPLDPMRPWGVATERLANWLVKEVGWSGPTPLLDDGSGLSRHNGVTSRGLVDLLLWARRQPWFNRYLSCLPSAGDGTLKGRLQGSTVRAKTGTLSGVVALSGYLTEKPSGRQLTFSIIVNQSARNSQFTRRFVDDIAVALENGALHDSISPTIFHQPLDRACVSNPLDPLAHGDRLGRFGDDRSSAPLGVNR